MAEKKSIGYIPPTPFRDDSDVFVLPDETDLDAGEEVVDQAWLAEELEVLRAQRAVLNKRNADISGAFQLVLKQLNTQVGKPASVVAPAVSQEPVSPGSGQVREPVRTSLEVATQAPSIPDSAPQLVESPSEEPGEEPDRLAMLKAQLASRIKSFQIVSAERQAGAKERGDS